MGDEGLRRAFRGSPRRSRRHVGFSRCLCREKSSPRPHTTPGRSPRGHRPQAQCRHPSEVISRPSGHLGAYDRRAGYRQVRIRGTVLRRDLSCQRAKDETTETNLGTVGPTSDIIEPDLVELIKASGSPRSMSKPAPRNRSPPIGSGHPSSMCPRRRKRRIRRLDPTVTTENDLRDHEGRVMICARRHQDQSAGSVALHQPPLDLRRHRPGRAAMGQGSHSRGSEDHPDHHAHRP